MNIRTTNLVPIAAKTRDTHRSIVHRNDTSSAIETVLRCPAAHRPAAIHRQPNGPRESGRMRSPPVRTHCPPVATTFAERSSWRWAVERESQCDRRRTWSCSRWTPGRWPLAEWWWSGRAVVRSPRWIVHRCNYIGRSIIISSVFT